MHLLWQHDDDLLPAHAGLAPVARLLQALKALADDERVGLGEETPLRQGGGEEVAPYGRADFVVLDGKGED